MLAPFENKPLNLCVNREYREAIAIQLYCYKNLEIHSEQGRNFGVDNNTSISD